MARSGITYDLALVKEAKVRLKSLSRQKPKKKKLTLRDLIEELRSDIEQAKAAGHTIYDIATVLAKGGVLIKPATLKQYLREAQETPSKIKKIGRLNFQRFDFRYIALVKGDKRLSLTP